MANRTGRRPVPAVVQKSKRPALLVGMRVATRTGMPGGEFEYDFSNLACAEPLQRMYAEAFARKLAPGGGWRSPATATSRLNDVRRFAQFCGDYTPEIRTIEAVSVAVLNEFALLTTIGRAMAAAAIFREEPNLPRLSRDWAHRRSPKVYGKNGSYSVEEIALVRSAVFDHISGLDETISRSLTLAGDLSVGNFEGAVMRQIIAPVTDMAALDIAYLAYVAKERGSGNKPLSLSALRRRVYPTKDDVDILLLGIVLTYGWNLTTVLELHVPQPQVDHRNPNRGVYSLTLEKRRRGQRRFESRNPVYRNDGSKSDILTLALRITSQARVAYDRLQVGASTTRLLVYRSNLTGAFLVSSSYGSRPLEKKWGEPFKGLLVPARIRKTVNVMEQRTPNQNSRDTHVSTYVLPDKQARKAVEGTIALGIQSALDAAYKFEGILRSEPAPSGTETVFSSCADKFASPFQEDDAACRSSFFACFGCRNAVLTPLHMPRVTLIYGALQELRTAVAAEDWDAVWKPTFERITDIKENRVSRRQWDQAVSAVTAEDRELMRLMLNGDLDVT